MGSLTFFTSEKALSIIAHPKTCSYPCFRLSCAAALSVCVVFQCLMQQALFLSLRSVLFWSAYLFYYSVNPVSGVLTPLLCSLHWVSHTHLNISNNEYPPYINIWVNILLVAPMAWLLLEILQGRREKSCTIKNLHLCMAIAVHFGFRTAFGTETSLKQLLLPSQTPDVANANQYDVEMHNM